MTKKKHFGEEIRTRILLWWLDNRMVLGFFLVVLLAAGLTVFALLPRGSARIVTGAIEGLRITETGTDGYAMAKVRLSDRVVMVRVPRSVFCTVGSTVRLRKQQRRWWETYSLDWTGCVPGH